MQRFFKKRRKITHHCFLLCKTLWSGCIHFSPSWLRCYTNKTECYWLLRKNKVFILTIELIKFVALCTLSNFLWTVAWCCPTLQSLVGSFLCKQRTTLLLISQSSTIVNIMYVHCLWTIFKRDMLKNAHPKCVCCGELGIKSIGGLIKGYGKHNFHK